MEEFIKQIEIIEGLQTDTRAGCIIMLSEVKNQSRLHKRYKKAGQAISDINKQLLVISKKQR